MIVAPADAFAAARPDGGPARTTPAALRGVSPYGYPCGETESEGIPIRVVALGSHSVVSTVSR
ncbi:MAG: hypothetical protein JWN03_6362 [Nocardia sp.]|nr:hypothetical protein [Nocardia sp.]